MILPSLLCAFAFLSVSECRSDPSSLRSSRRDYTLTIVYNTSSPTRGNSSRTFRIPLYTFSSILDNISNDVESELGPPQDQRLNSIISQIQDAIPQLVRNPNNREVLNQFSNNLLRLLRGLRNSDSDKLNGIVQKLLRSFLERPDSSQDPQGSQDPASAAGRARVSPLINQLSGLASSLAPLISGGNSAVSGLLSNLLSQLRALPDASDIWSAVLGIITTVLSALENADPALEQILNSILQLAISILSNLSSMANTFNGLPSFLVTMLVKLAQQGWVDIASVQQALRGLSSPAGEIELGDIIPALNTLIEALTNGAPEAITSLIGTLTSQLTQFASGSIEPQSIVDTLQQLVQAVVADPNAASYESSIAIILNAIGLLLGDMNGIGDIIQQLLSQLNVSVNVSSSGGCSGLVGGILCTVGDLVNGLLGGGSGRDLQQLARTATGAAESSGGLVGGVLNGVGNLVTGITGTVGGLVNGLLRR